MNLSWENDDSFLLINPSYSEIDQEDFRRILKEAQHLRGHIWLSTSGSSVQKWVGLSKQALLASGHAVNSHLKSTQEDRWVNALPFFHVGGVGIWARAYLSGAKVYDFKEEYPGKWSAETFYEYIQKVDGTLTALVPAQLHDLVMLRKEAPSSMRAMIIGGGALLPSLYEKAVDSKWPVLPSYGLTECASQVATAGLDSWRQGRFPDLQLLPHLQACEIDGRLAFAGSSLLTAYAFFQQKVIQLRDPKIDGWLITEDRGIICNDRLEIIGRMDAMVKIGGENVDISSLENLLQTLRLQLGVKCEITLIALPDSRLGHCINLASTCLEQEEIKSVIDQFQQRVLPFERIRKVYFVSEIPRTSLGKIHKEQLMKLVSSYA